MTAPAVVANVISVDGWSCYDYPDPPADTDGNIWVWQTIDGWFGGVDVRSQVQAQPMIDGDFDGIAPFTGRTITIGGTLVAIDRPGLQRGMDRFGQVLAGAVRRDSLVVSEGAIDLVRSAMVRLGGASLITRISTLTAEFSLVLYSADPLRYGSEVKTLWLTPYVGGTGRTYNLVPPRQYGAQGSAGTGRALNNGNAQVGPVITFYGPSVNPCIQVTPGGNLMKLLMTLAANDVVVMDCSRRTITFQGASRRQYLSADSRWIQLNPGATDLMYTVSSGSSSRCSVQWQDAWS